MTVECLMCDRTFGSRGALDQHCRDIPGHGVYCSCGRMFMTAEAQAQHFRDSSVHRIRYTCNLCKKRFADDTALQNHLSDSTKHLKPAPQCTVCSEIFSSVKALRQHENSRVHAEPTFHCPLCAKTFKQPSAIAHHVESSTCPRCAPITRQQVTTAVHSMDIIPTISLENRIEGPSADTVQTTYTANQFAWNPEVRAFVCPLCSAQLKTLPSLNQHLNSAAHDGDNFKCPKKKCGRQFSVISAFIQHIESGACGLTRFAQIEDYTTGLLDQFTRLLKI